MINHWPNDIKDLHLELSSHCQASCPGCSRPYDYGNNILNNKKAYTWSLSDLKKKLSDDFLKQLNSLLLCGNYGDPLFFNELNEWLEYLFVINPKLSVIIHTNGGVGTIETWAKLGKTLNRPYCLVKFSIDGLADTNAIYRRGVDFNIIMKNAETFIENGGRAVWKFLVFKHNEHQISLANDLAIKMGFKKFETRTPHDPDANYLDTISAKELTPHTQVNFQNLETNYLQNEVFKDLTAKEIKCVAIENRSIYIDADKKVWPCCWLSQDGDHRTRTLKRELFHREVFDNKISTNFNSLDENSLNEILKHDFFTRTLIKSWQSSQIESKKCFPTCLKTCGIKNG